MKWLILLVGIGFNASASVMIKVAVTPPRALPSLREPVAALSNWALWIGLGLYGGAFLLFAAALERLPLNVAHPILTSGAIAAVALLSILIFDESFVWTTAAGIVLIAAGVGLIAAHTV